MKIFIATVIYILLNPILKTVIYLIDKGVANDVFSEESIGQIIIGSYEIMLLGPILIVLVELIFAFAVAIKAKNRTSFDFLSDGIKYLIGFIVAIFILFIISSHSFFDRTSDGNLIKTYFHFTRLWLSPSGILIYTTIILPMLIYIWSVSMIKKKS